MVCEKHARAIYEQHKKSHDGDLPLRGMYSESSLTKNKSFILFIMGRCDDVTMAALLLFTIQTFVNAQYVGR